MTESLKFGPEWLRNTVAPTVESNSSTSSTVPSIARYPLAEFRYGREEMLSLFDKNIKLPDIYSKYKKLFVDKIQCPLALTPSTEDEVEYPRGIWPTRSVGAPGGISGRGRGSSADRGRGRGRSLYHPSLGYQRSTSLYDEEGRSIGRGERSWLERNGSGDPSSTDWNSTGQTTSPRKEYGRAGAENWRRSRTDEEGTSGTTSSTDWRSSGFTSSREKWTGRSWRDEDNNANHTDSSSYSGITRSYSTPSGSNGIERSGSKPYSSSSGPMKKKSWEQTDDSLPEWATEDPSDYGGSFDATGAFHDSEEDDLHRRSVSDADQTNNRVSPEKQSNVDINKSHSRNDVKPGERIDSEKLPLDRSDTNKLNYEAEKGSTNQLRDESENSSSRESESKSRSSDTSEKEPSPADSILKEQSSSLGAKDSNHSQVESQPQQSTELRRVAGTGRVQNISESSVDRMPDAAEDMVAQLIMEDELINAFENDLAIGKSSPLLNSLNANRGVGVQQQPARPSLGSTGSPEYWFYQDPQNKVQGPFSATEMSEWYRAGYFDETLFVRRGCDTRFSTLGDLIKICGGSIPFMASHLIPPMVTPELPPIQNPLLSVLSNSNNPQTPAPQLLDSDMQLKYQLHLLQKQFMMRQQQLILHKLMATEPWSMLTQEQQNAMLNHHMSQVTLPDNLLSTASLVGLTQPQLQQLHQQTLQSSTLYGSNMNQQHSSVSNQKSAPVSQTMGSQQSNINNVPSSMIPMNQTSSQQQQQQQKLLQQQQQQQQQQQVSLNQQQQPQRRPNNAPVAGIPVSGQQNPEQLRQLIHSMSLGHLMPQQNTANQPPIPTPTNTVPQSKASPMENDPIKSLIFQLSMQKGNVPGNIPAMPPHQQLNQMQTQKPMLPNDPLFSWGSMPGNQPATTGIQHVIQNQNQFQHQIRSMPGFNMMENELELRKHDVPNTMGPWNNKPVNHNSSTAAPSLLSMWEMPPIKTPIVNNSHVVLPSSFDTKTEHELLEKHRQQLIGDQQQQQIENQLSGIIKDLEVNESENNHKQKVEIEEELHKPQKVTDAQIKEKENKKQIKKETEVETSNKISTNKGNNKKADVDAKASQKASQAKKEADEKKRKAEEKKRAKELKERQQLEEAKKKAAEDKRKQEELIEQQRKSKLLENNRREAQKIQEEQAAQAVAIKVHQQQKPVTQMAPWSNSISSGQVGPSLAEIEKAERQQRAEQIRIEQAMREQREQQQLFEMQQQKESILKWNPKNIMQAAVKSLAEIQAEEHAKQTAAEREHAALQAAKQREKEKEALQNSTSFFTAWNTSAQQSAWSTGKIWGQANAAGNTTSGGGFWEEPTKMAHPKQVTGTKMLAKSQTMGSITTNKAAANEKQAQQQLQPKAANKSTGNVTTTGMSNSNEKKIKAPKGEKKNDSGINAEFTDWCFKALNNINADVDVPTFVGFLQDIESPFEVKDYIKMYLGETKECIEFSKQFLERRSKLKNQQRAQNAHIDDMCSPAPALTPNDFQEVKVKNKTKKGKTKGKMTKVDNRMLGFSVTAAPHWNLEKNMEGNDSGSP